MKKALLGLSIVAIMMLAAAPAALAGGMGHGHMTGMALCPCMDKKLGLSEDQQKKVDALRQKTEKKTAADIKKMKALKAAMKELWKAAKPSRKAILAKQAQIHKIKRKLGTAKVDAHLAFLKILTAEQKATLDKEMATCCQGQGHPAGCQCPHCKGMGQGCPKGCQCPKCKQKAAADQPAKDTPCQGCPKKECPHHK